MSWSDTVEDAELAVACSGARHRLRWSRGEVTMVDHPEAEAELALVALGGAEPPCLTMANLWAAAIEDGGFLEEWVDDTHLDRARLSWLGMALERLRNEGFHEFLRSLPPARAEQMGRFLHAFPRPWLDRAVGAVAAEVIDGDGVTCINARPLLRQATTQRTRRSFVASVGRDQLSLGAAALVPLHVAVGHEDGPATRPTPGIEGRLRGEGRGVTITVAEGWLHRVWAAGAAVIDDRLVLDLDGREATMVRWRDDRPRLESVPVDHDGTRWRRQP